MPDEIRKCKWCGRSFTWSEKDEKERALDLAAGTLPDESDPSHECKSCRVKQDQQRS